jgi:Protein of unknown function (DUF3987)
VKLVPARKCPDWIESFQALTSDIPSPEPFRLWSAISIIAGALQRRAWISTAHSLVYPNLYVLLVSPPGVGKSQAISRAGEFWVAADTIHVAPDSVTRASLIDCLEGASTKAILPDGTFQQYHSLTVPASEFGVLVPAHDLEFLNTLNHIYDNPKYYRENRRSRNKQVDIPFPMLNILGGTQPAYLASLLPEQAWGMGFTSRLIMVYSAEMIRPNLFDLKEYDDKLQKRMGDDLKTIGQLYGKFAFDPDAQRHVEEWAGAGLPPIPTHGRLQNYNSRRLLHFLKLCMVSSVSHSNDLRITMEDLSRAKDWLLDAEYKMPDIFRDMAGKSDKQVMDDLHDFMWRMYARDKKPIHISRIVGFLGGKVPADKVMRVVDLCERSEVIQRDAGTTDLYRPCAHDHLPGVD